MSGGWIQSIWDSLPIISTALQIAEWAVVAGVLAIVLLTMRKDELRNDGERAREQTVAVEIARTKSDATETKRLAEEATLGARMAILDKQRLEIEAEAARAEEDKLRKDNARLSAKVEEEREARLLVEAQVAPRRITLDQGKMLSTRLSDFKGQTVKLVRPSGSGEIDVFAKYLGSALEKAGLDVSIELPTRREMFPPGLSLRFGASRQPLHDVLEKVLVEAGLCRRPVISEMAGDSQEFVIQVGQRQ